MIYKNPEIPSNFNKIAEISDNYVVWVRENRLESGNSYQAYIQYSSPSFAYFYTDAYRIKDGDSYVYNISYTNNGVYSFIDDVTPEYSKTTLQVANEDITDSESSRADFPNIWISQVLYLCIFVAICFLVLPRQVRGR